MRACTQVLHRAFALNATHDLLSTLQGLPATYQVGGNYFGTLELRWPARAAQQENTTQDSQARQAGRARREGSRSEVRGSRNFERRTSDRAGLALPPYTL